MKIKDTPLGPYVSAADSVIGAAVLSILGALGGSWLDGKLHCRPWFALFLTFAGMVAGLMRMILKATDDSEDADADDSEVGTGKDAPEAEGEGEEEQDEAEEDSSEDD